MSAGTQNEVERLLARVTRVEEERDALAAHVERISGSAKRFYNATVGESGVEVASPIKRLVDEVNEATEELRESVEATPTTSLARRDARVAAEAMREIAEWMDPESDKFSGPTYHEAEMIGMEISGPTFCSDARRCMKAGNRAFLEAARIWEHDSRQDEEGS